MVCVTTQCDKVFVLDNGNTYRVPFEQCENWLSRGGFALPFTHEQLKKAAEHIVYETGNKYLEKKKAQELNDDDSKQTE